MAPLVPIIVETTASRSCAELAAYPGRRDVVAATYIRASAVEEKLYLKISYPDTDAEYAAVVDEGVEDRKLGASFTTNPYGIADGKPGPTYQFRAYNAHEASYVANFSNVVPITGHADADDYLAGDSVVFWPFNSSEAVVEAVITGVETSGGALQVTLDTSFGYAGGGYCVPKSRAFRYALADAPDGVKCDETTGRMSGNVSFATPTGNRECRILVATPDAIVSSTSFTMRIVAAAPGYSYVWDTQGMESWIESMVGGREPRLRSAFRLGSAGDAGRPALVPAGMRFEIDGTVSSSFRTSSSQPVLSAFEPWMMGVGVYVCVDSFWSPPQHMRQISTTGSTYLIDRADVDSDTNTSELALVSAYT